MLKTPRLEIAMAAVQDGQPVDASYTVVLLLELFLLQGRDGVLLNTSREQKLKILSGMRKRRFSVAALELSYNFDFNMFEYFEQIKEDLINDLYESIPGQPSLDDLNTRLSLYQP